MGGTMNRDFSFAAGFPTDPKAHAEWLKEWERGRKKEWEEEQAELKGAAVMCEVYDERNRQRAAAAKAQSAMRQICADLVANPYTEVGVPGTLRELILRLVLLVEQLDESDTAASPR
jgi:hypothetical protein